MQTSSEKIRDQQRETWNRFSPGWRKWDDFNMRFLEPMGKAIIAELQLQAGDNVLDIATGTGEPGLTIARIGAPGTVIGTDLAEGMLETAAASARTRGISNYSTRVADVSALPFPDRSFEAASCRMGFMFFPDMLLAAKEVARVLKPGGRFSTSVWAGGGNNPWITTMMTVVQRHLSLPAPAPDSPGMFRCSAPGIIGGLLRESGFEAVTENEVSGEVTFESAEQYLTMMLEVAAPVVAAMSKTDEATRTKIKAEVRQTLVGLGSPLTLGFHARVISGVKN